MKSIYDEALDDLIWLSDDEFVYNLNAPKLDESQRFNMFKKVKEALKQAQKQEKLLKLYEELITVKDDMLSCCEVTDLDYYDIIDIEFDLEQQIGELYGGEL